MQNSNLKIIRNPAGHVPPFSLCQDEDIVEPVHDFLKELDARGFSKATLRAYAFDLLAFYRFLVEHNLNIDHLTHLNFVDFILAHRRQNAAPRTINRRLTCVRSFLNSQFEGLGDKLLKRYSSSFYKGRKNKALLGPSRIKDKIPKSLSVKVPAIILTPLRAAEIRKFLIGLRKYRDQSIVYLMLLCGLRSSEVLKLELNDIDFIDGQIRINGKGNKQRVIPLPQTVRKSLDHYINFERPAFCKHSKLITVLQGPNSGLPLSSENDRLLQNRLQSSNSPYALIFLLLRHTGLRISELINLPWNPLILKTNTSKPLLSLKIKP